MNSQDLRVQRASDSDSFQSLYPITVADALLAGAEPGQHFEHLALGDGAGNFSWLSWSGDTDANTLAGSLVPPGDSGRYIHPDDGADARLDAGGWAQGGPGVQNSGTIRARLDALLGRNLIVPVWGEQRRRGANHDYLAARFAVIALTDYRLGGQGHISFEFRRFTRCYNRRPQAPDAAVTTPEDTALTFTLPAQDGDGDALSYQIVDGPAPGSITVSAARVEYAPPPDVFGHDELRYRVHDGEQWSETGTVAIEITPVNDAPVADDRSVELTDDTSLVLTLSGSDVEGDPLSCRIVTPPGHGRIEEQAGGFVYLPDAGYYGADALQYVANDGRLDSAPATVSITVIRTNAPPEIVTSPVTTVLEYAPYRYDVDAIDPDGDVLTFDSTGYSGRVSIDAATGELSWIPSRWFFTASTEAENPYCAAPVPADTPYWDVTDWQVFRHDGVHGGIQYWNASADGTTAVATGNGSSSGYVSGVELSDAVVEITIRVESYDDDFIGFVWGFQDSEHYYRLRWVQTAGFGIQVTKVDSPGPGLRTSPWRRRPSRVLCRRQ